MSRKMYRHGILWLALNYQHGIIQLNNRPRSASEMAEMEQTTMANQQQAIYDGYVKRTTANNVEPSILRGDEVFAFLREHGADFNSPSSYQTKFWDGRGRVFDLPCGSVAEYSTTNTAIGTPLLAVFEKGIDYANYRRPLGMFHYLYT